MKSPSSPRSNRRLLPINASAMSLAEAIVHRRVILGYTQADLSAKAGISRLTLARIETGQANPAHSTLVKLAAALKTHLEIIFNPHLK